MLDPADVPLAPRVGDLDDVAAVVLVHPRDELAPEGDAVVAVDVRVAGDDQAARVHGRVRRDDRADPRAREPDVPADPRLGAGPVVVVEATGEAGAEEAVLDRERS